MLWLTTSQPRRQAPSGWMGDTMPGRSVYLSPAECAELGRWRT